MKKENLIEKMKHNDRVFGELSPEEQEVLGMAGPKNCLARYNEDWSETDKPNWLQGGWTFKLKPDYKPPEPVKKKTQWLTREYIREQAKKGLLEATRVSLEHHWQIHDADPEDFREAYMANEVDTRNNLCGLCQANPDGSGDHWDGCPLGDSKGCCKEWRILTLAVDKFLFRNGGYSAVVHAEDALIARLEAIRDNLLKNKTKAEPEIERCEVTISKYSNNLVYKRIDGVTHTLEIVLSDADFIHPEDKHGKRMLGLRCGETTTNDPAEWPKYLLFRKR